MDPKSNREQEIAVSQPTEPEETEESACITINSGGFSIA